MQSHGDAHKRAGDRNRCGQPADAGPPTSGWCGLGWGGGDNPRPSSSGWNPVRISHLPRNIMAAEAAVRSQPTRLSLPRSMSPELSIVIPVRNESPNIKGLYDELTTTLVRSGRSYEIIVIDDGSTDDTFEQLAALQSRDPHLRVIQFRRNFGQTAAFAAGFAFARGRLVVTSDGDLQNDPADIPRMADAITEGYDIVCGWRKDRKDRLWSRRVPSILANRLISWATGVPLHDYGCSLKVFRSEVVKPLRLYGEMHRFLPAIASQFGVRIKEEVVNHRPRTAGVSKYGLSRTIRVVLDLMTVKFLLSYSTRPLQIF